MSWQTAIIVEATNRVIQALTSNGFNTYVYDNAMIGRNNDTQWCTICAGNNGMMADVIYVIDISVDEQFLVVDGTPTAKRFEGLLAAPSVFDDLVASIITYHKMIVADCIFIEKIALAAAKMLNADAVTKPEETEMNEVSIEMQRLGAFNGKIVKNGNLIHILASDRTSSYKGSSHTTYVPCCSIDITGAAIDSLAISVKKAIEHHI